LLLALNNYDKLKEILTEIFEIDKADLDFGIYRIINQKRDQVTDFINNRLPKDIKDVLAATQSKDGVTLQVELDKVIKSAVELGVSPDALPKVIELKTQIAASIDTVTLEQEVFSHLASFFKRYYKEGDFISMRRYKKDVYAIPYEGEEVKLHWANHDQYYIKTSEYLKNYTFKLRDGKTVHFRLKEASTEQNNNKSQGDTERNFAIYTVHPVDVEDSVLYINFTYEPHKKTAKQDELSQQAFTIVRQQIPAEFTALFDKVPTDKNKGRTVLEKHLVDFISRNSFDYFIHKDLCGFLNRELDFYIKNEVLFLDDINTENPAYFTAQLSKIKALKTVACKIINFLAQIEDFQKKLWLKKKFVISTGYCITLDRVPQEFYSEIAANKTQLAEWKDLFGVTIANETELKNELFLVMDTKHFTEDFTDRLLGHEDFIDLDERTDGLLINSENFQALNLLQEKYKEKIDVAYIDPPYNAQSSEILYKNTFKNSSWLSLMENRISLSKPLLNNSFVQIIAIDEVENFNLGKALESIFPDCRNSTISIVHNPTGQQGDNFSFTHEFAHFVFPAEGNYIGLENRNDNTREAQPDVRPLRNVSSGKDHLRESAANCFYPIFVKDGKLLGFGEVCDKNFHPQSINVKKDNGIIEIYPIDPSNTESKWVFARDTVESIIDELTIKYDSKKDIYDVIRTKSNFRYKSLWNDKRYSANSWGSVILNHIFPGNPFKYPKSIYTVKDSIDAGLNNFNTGTILDYFAGSATTGHATIKLNREDGGKRKYILVEVGTYFNTVTKPRIQKVIYTDNWKGGQPLDKKGISQMFKYQALESYEDVLNNLQLQTKAATLQFNQTAQEEYLLKYMLDLESRDHLFDTSIFRDPFNYRLKITQNNELQPTKIDLVETFNYLIGLYVARIQRVKDIKLVEGHTREGKKTLVIWRNLNTTTNAETQTIFRKLYDSVRSAEFDQIFINGDHHFDNLRQGQDQFKVKLIEETFYKKMFNN
jgi:adenine-specific DNA-methyltransferase